MSTPPTPPAKSARVSPGLIGAGLLVVALGFGLPMLTSHPAPESAPPAAAPGAKPQEPVAIAAPSTAGLGWSVLKLVVGLAVVCGLCVLVARYAGPKPLPPPKGMEVLAAITVGRGVVHLVRAGDRRLVIGTDPAGVKALVELPGPDPAPAAPPPPAEPEGAAAPVPPSREEILNLLLRLRGRTAAPPPP